MHWTPRQTPCRYQNFTWLQLWGSIVQETKGLYFTDLNMKLSLSVSLKEPQPSSQLDWSSRGLSSSQDGTSPRWFPPSLLGSWVDYSTSRPIHGFFQCAKTFGSLLWTSLPSGHVLLLFIHAVFPLHTRGSSGSPQQNKYHCCNHCEYYELSGPVLRNDWDIPNKRMIRNMTTGAEVRLNNPN